MSIRDTKQLHLLGRLGISNSFSMLKKETTPTTEADFPQSKKQITGNSYVLPISVKLKLMQTLPVIILRGNTVINY